MSKKTKTVTVAAPTGQLDRHIEGFLKERFGKDVRIRLVKSPWIFSNPNGLKTVIVSNQHVGRVFINEKDFLPAVVAEAKESGLVFGTIERSQTHLHNASAVSN